MYRPAETAKNWSFRASLLYPLLPTLALLLGCGSDPEANQGEFDLMNADRARAQAQLGADAEAYARSYAQNAVVYFPGAPAAMGKAAVVEFLRGQRSEEGFRMAEQLADATVSESGELGYTTGAFVLTKRVENSKGQKKRVEFKGNYVSLWRKHEDGTWECTHHVSNYRPDWGF